MSTHRPEVKWHSGNYESTWITEISGICCKGINGVIGLELFVTHGLFANYCFKTHDSSLSSRRSTICGQQMMTVRLKIGLHRVCSFSRQFYDANKHNMK